MNATNHARNCKTTFLVFLYPSTDRNPKWIKIRARNYSGIVIAKNRLKSVRTTDSPESESMVGI